MLSRRSLPRFSVIGAAGVALPPSIYRVAGLHAASRPSVAGTAVPHRHHLAPAGRRRPQRYVFHCHILEHEDNSMMRPLLIVP